MTINGYTILSIDVGVCHLGLSVTLVNERFDLEEVIWIDLINITDYKHCKVMKEDCMLYHTKTFSDWMDHVFQENIEWFEKSDFILVEKQPPQGFVVVEQLIFSRWRKKTILVSPVKVHSFLRIMELDYEGRKRHSEIVGSQLLSDELRDQLECYVRKHDVTDSLCMMLYWIYTKSIEVEKKEKIEYYDSLNVEGVNIGEWFRSFSYVGNTDQNVRQYE